MKLFKEILPYLIIIVIVVIIRTFIITPVRVNGDSMKPILVDKEIVLLKKYDKNYKRFDIVVFNDKRGHLIKRIVGLPGETLYYSNNKLFVNGKYIKEDFLGPNEETYDYELEEVIPEGYYFVMGDNRDNSTDSRIIGLVSEEDILGTTSFVLYPFNRFGNI